ncbi:hypothetical protein [Youngiibacter multivorans]|uniref:RNA-binding Zn-ribbon protein involved in translation (DUF1610 family) n=1 Tax=Youngiibacter multivorans TaxID=937251 RepID=A0ABS4G8W0_9CLOT|nr:hypothetical protein [Youngiibacter multivorans]MBP1920964.1 putative RNA-binding Zn-ribbon protein involved in translation (DUF1610 family) [Youngiibacter multivorans]
MKGKITKEYLGREGLRSIVKVSNICTICEKEYAAQNIYTSMYCPECAAEVKKEKTRLRVAKYRAKKLTEENKIEGL